MGGGKLAALSAASAVVPVVAGVGTTVLLVTSSVSSGQPKLSFDLAYLQKNKHQLYKH